MGFLDEVKRKLVALGMNPLPPEWEAVFSALASASDSDTVATFFWRMSSWPSILLALASKYDISATDGETLRNIFMRVGKGAEFKAQISAMKKRVAQPTPARPEAQEEKAARLEREVEELRSKVFSGFISELRKQYPEASVDEATLAQWRSAHIIGMLDMKAARAHFAESVLPKPPGQV